MRHRVATKKLSRDTDHRKMLLRNLSSALVTFEKVDTTLAKAKFVQAYVEEIITKAIRASKSQDKIVRFNAYKALRTDMITEDAVKKLLDDVAHRYESATGGYTRIVKTGNRDGDNSATARIELTKKAKKTKGTTEKKDTKKTEVKEVKEELSKEVKKEEK
jgi:large subunit ribosomal protein L17